MSADASSPTQQSTVRQGGPSSSATAPQEASRWPAFAVCAAVAVLTILDLAKVNVTLGPIEHTLGAASSDVQLIVAGYVLAFGILLVPSGRLGDLWNRKRLFLIGLVAFALASLVCALSVSTEMLIGGRILQGFAAGILMPQVLGLIQQLFTGQERGRAFGIFGAIVGLGTAFGPTIGGLLIGLLGEEAGWRWTFAMNVPLALVVLPFAWRLLPSRQEVAKGQTLDLFGVALLGLAVLTTMLPFVLTSGRDTDDPARWWLLAPALGFFVAFILWERRYLRIGKTPVVDFALFRTPSYRYGVLITTLFFAAMPVGFLLVTLFLQQGLGHPAVLVGAVSVPYALTSAVVAAVSGKWTFQHGATLVAVGVALFVVGYSVVLVVTQLAEPALSPYLVSASLVISGAGAGLVMGANQMRMLLHVPVEQAGIAGSFAQVGQRLGNAMGLAIGSSVFFAGVAALQVTGAVQDTSSPVVQEAYKTSVAGGLLVVICLACLTLVVAVVDLVGHRRRQREQQVGE
ncbi:MULTISPECIES: MFS transporter [unclassified Pseudoclavibacter]|uniref:MFS transporter n=1 Tax=unclassified Pseudoclavibacter TaxID=2615177 RepID=UPI001BA6E9CE|nr:MFS transporter [Pseudoclavibacter sp. Marseille-Q4354]MBS3177606.1 MFS transporter [Pseudoclavibacter sp. Marseille-Q4354]